MIADVEGSLNEALRALWAAIAPAVPMAVGHPAPPDTLPAECLRVFWLNHGNDGPETQGMVQLDVFVPGNRRRVALTRADALDAALGLKLNAGRARLAVYDTGDVSKPIGQADIQSLEGGWTTVPDPSPGMVHLAQTLEVFGSPLT